MRSLFSNRIRRVLFPLLLVGSFMGFEACQSAFAHVANDVAYSRPVVDLQTGRYVVLNDDKRLDDGDVLTITGGAFNGGERAEIMVLGDGDGDLDLWVYDARTGELIGSDTDETSICIVRWYPRYRQSVVIRVANVGDVWEEFYVVGNW